MKTDSILKSDIEQELRRDAAFSSNNVHVAVENGGASLYGTVHTEAEKTAAEDATRRMGAVLVNAQSLQVLTQSDCERSDAALATAVRRALRWNLLVPASVHARVAGGIVTLEGHVTWGFQQRAAARAVRRMKNVAWVDDAVLLAPATRRSPAHDAVKAALARRGTSDANSIHVSSSGGKVTLSGYARSPDSIADARFAALGVPGVTAVIEDVQSPADRLTQLANAVRRQLVPARATAAVRPTPATGNESPPEIPEVASPLVHKADIQRR